MARGCALEELVLSGGLSALTDFSIRVLGEECHASLTALDLSATRVTDAAAHALAGTHGSRCCQLRVR